jgi:oxalate decarboxylase/phosphoglucose isomerase-like protein (cupin superfamily)
MAKDGLVSTELAKKFAPAKEAPYHRYVREEGLEILESHFIPNLRHLELKTWARRGGRGVFLNHDASRTTNDCYVCEIRPGGKLEPQRQIYEEMILVLDGRGSTTVWNDAGHRVTFEWKDGSIFGIPLNCWHQHFNGSGAKAARFVAVTNAPPLFNLFEDMDFIFNSTHDFRRRFNGEPDYFAPHNTPDGFTLDTNFIPDAMNLPLPTAETRGAGGGHIRFNLARASIRGHISQFPVGTYKKAHAHGPGAHVVILSGEGYTLDWPDENGDPVRLDWQVGSMLVPKDGVYHQHFNSGAIPSRYLAFKHSAEARNSQGVPLSFISKRYGGSQLDYADESPAVRKMFEEAMAKHRIESRMAESYQNELTTLPPIVA